MAIFGTKIQGQALHRLLQLAQPDWVALFAPKEASLLPLIEKQTVRYAFLNDWEE